MSPTSSSYRPAAQLDICCPLCGFEDDSSYILLLHIETMHPEQSGTLTKAAQNDSSLKSEQQFTHNVLATIRESRPPEYLICDLENCGEPIALADMDTHMDLHYAERLALTDVVDDGDAKHRVGTPRAGSSGLQVVIPSANTKRPRSTSEQESDGQLVLFDGSSSVRKRRTSKPQSVDLAPFALAIVGKKAAGPKKPGRLGKADLGPYADEKEMPKRLLELCAQGGKVITRQKIGPDGKIVRFQSVENETENLITTMSMLCEADPGVAQAWLCHPSAKHVGKQGTGREVFCGYRNIQMLISYIQAMYPEGSHPFTGRIPSILRIQEWIEEGWDRGINTTGRIETGGIKNTRRFIGTSEAQTLFTRLGIPCRPVPFHKSNELNTQLNLLNYVEQYFKGAVPEGTKKAKVYVTPRPPIYFQQPGHSMTIVGIERTRDGWQNLLVFDPVFEPSGAIRDLEGSKRINSSVNAAAVLKAYRRGLDHLRRFQEFEILTLEQAGAARRKPDSRYGGVSRSGSSASRRRPQNFEITAEYEEWPEDDLYL